jgi:mannitol-1-/sugar-/sorbitol-6-phosphatase
VVETVGPLTVTLGGRPDGIHCAALLFDMDGTLVDSRTCVRRTWSAWCHRHGIDPARLFAVSEGRRNRETVRIVAPHLDVDVQVEALVAAEERCREGLRPIPGAAAVLADLTAGRWAIVTSAWRRLAEIRLDAAGLPWPDVLVTADDVIDGKPHPEGYLRAAAALGVDAGDCLVFEDAPAGLRAAAAAGMRSLRVGGHPGHRQVPDLTTVRVTESHPNDRSSIRHGLPAPGQRWAGGVTPVPGVHELRRPQARR